MGLRVITDVAEEGADLFLDEQQAGAPGEAAKIPDIGEMANEESVETGGGEVLAELLLARGEVHGVEFNSPHWSVRQPASASVRSLVNAMRALHSGPTDGPAVYDQALVRGK